MSAQPELEARVQAACHTGDFATATTLVLEGYGGEILALLAARLPRRTDADEVFAIVAEKLWLGLPGFEWRCGVLSWLYRLARNAANDYAKAAGNRPERNLALSDHAPLSAIVDRVRTATEPYRQTAVKDRMRELRERLSPDDQMLLILRVDRSMDFRELVVAMSDESAPIEDAAIDREAARLRKRFERIKDRLRAMAKDEGLL